MIAAGPSGAQKAVMDETLLNDLLDAARAAGAENMLTGMGTSTPEAVTVQYRQSAGEDAGRIQCWDPTPAPARPP